MRQLGSSDFVPASCKRQELSIYKLAYDTLYMRHVMPHSGTAQPHFVCRIMSRAGCCGQLACMIPAMKAPSSTLREEMETQSRLREAGTAPMVENRPRVGFIPMHPQKPAGTRPPPCSQPIVIICKDDKSRMGHLEVFQWNICSQPLSQANALQGQGAGDRQPKPATSVPSANITSPLPTAGAEPEEEPPGMKLSSKGLRATP